MNVESLKKKVKFLKCTNHSTYFHTDLGAHAAEQIIRHKKNTQYCAVCSIRCIQSHLLVFKN